MQLQILNQDFWDENQKAVLCRQFYFELWLDEWNYVRWCKRNITENDFAEEWIDYINYLNNSITPYFTPYFDTSSSDGGVFEQKTEDFILSMRFAKKLAILAKTKKWEEVRNYFLDLEEKYKLLLKFEQLVLASHDFSRDITKWLLDCWYKEKYINELNIIDNWLKSVELWPLYKESPKNIYSSFIAFTKSTISRPVLYDKLELLWFKRIQIDWYEYFKWIKLWQ